MDDVLSQIVLAGRDEDLGTGNLVAAVAVRHRAGAQQAEIRAALRLGQVHGAGPVAGDHLRHVGLLEDIAAVDQQGRDRALRQPRIHAERHVGGGLELCHRLGQHHRQALAAIFGRRGETEPAAVGQLTERLLEAFRRGDAAVLVASAAFEVADPVERLQHLLADSRRLAEDRLADIRGGVAKSGKVVVAVHLEDVVEQEVDVVQRRFVARHVVLRDVKAAPLSKTAGIPQYGPARRPRAPFGGPSGAVGKV